MQSRLDKLEPLSRIQFGRLVLSALVLGFCAFTQPAPGWAQLGTAESCFDDGPATLPQGPLAASPTLPVAAPAVAQLPLAPAGIRRTKASRAELTKVERPKVLITKAWPPNRGSPGHKYSDALLTASR